MVEFHPEQLSINELIEAAEGIFTAQEKDFEKLKSEKWYQSLFHAITLNQDGKKYIVRGINSLTKLQQLFMDIYVKNYKDTHEQLDAVIEVVIKNSEAINRLYGMCVLNLEEQESLEALDAQDAEILALLLGEYRDENGKVPNEVRDYNRGVLTALNQKIPIGTLDNHQIRRLKAPKVVYRCFMEQCAVHGTIDTQAWTGKIKEYIKDFELSENSKNEIKESVKNEAEIAGIKYFIDKYKKNSIGTLDTDFVIDLENSNSPEDPELKALKQQIDLSLLSLRLLQFSSVLSTEIYNNILSYIKNPYEENSVSLTSSFKDEIDNDISNGTIKLPCLIDSIKKSCVDDYEVVHAFKLKKTDDDFNEYSYYFMIATIDGLFFFIDEKTAFIEYDNIYQVNQDQNSVTISAGHVEWYSQEGKKISGEDKIIIREEHIGRKHLRPLRKSIEKLIEEFDGYIESPDDLVKKIIEKYIKKIPKGASAVPYLTADFGFFDDKERNKMKNALTKYALKVREDEVIGFIDTSLFGNGGAGILFSKHGLAFTYAFEKIFARYEEIDRIEIKKQKKLILHGHFSERKNDSDDPSIDNIYYNLFELKKCLEEILCVV